MATPVRMSVDSALELFGDADGFVTVGWIATRVLYARFHGDLSAGLGAAFAAHVAGLVEGTSGVRYFADAAELGRRDILARSAFVRMVLANRPRFAAFVMLVPSDGARAAERAMATALGGCTEVLSDADEFRSRLLAAAPLARQRLRSPPEQRHSLRPARLVESAVSRRPSGLHRR